MLKLTIALLSFKDFSVGYFILTNSHAIKNFIMTFRFYLVSYLSILLGIQSKSIEVCLLRYTFS
jgi:hypothetical protein